MIIYQCSTKCPLPIVQYPLWIFDNWDSQGYLQVQRSCWHNSSWCLFFGEVLHLWHQQAFKLCQDYFLWYLFSFHKLHTSYYTTTSLILQAITLQMVFLLFIQAVTVPSKKCRAIYTSPSLMQLSLDRSFNTKCERKKLDEDFEFLLSFYLSLML